MALTHKIKVLKVLASTIENKNDRPEQKTFQTGAFKDTMRATVTALLAVAGKSGNAPEMLTFCEQVLAQQQANVLKSGITKGFPLPNTLAHSSSSFWHHLPRETGAAPTIQPSPKLGQQ